MNLRDQVVNILINSNIILPKEFGDDTPLISSGICDSLGLFHLVNWVQENIRSDVDITSFDLAKEWNTVADICCFVKKYR